MPTRGRRATCREAGRECPDSRGHAAETPGWLRSVRRRPLPGPKVFQSSSPALILLDMQHYFCSPQGAAYFPSSETIVPRLAALKLAFERAGLPVIFTQHGHGKDEVDHPLLRWWTRDIVANTWEDELDSRLGPGPGSVVIRKDQYSAFRAPEFRKALARCGTRALVIGGVMTNLCCETTARDAFMEGFDVYFLADGTASKDLQSHLGTLRTIAYGFGYVATCKEVRACLP